LRGVYRIRWIRLEGGGNLRPGVAPLGDGGSKVDLLVRGQLEGARERFDGMGIRVLPLPSLKGADSPGA